MTNEAQKIVDEGKSFGFTVTQGEWNEEHNEVWITGEHEFGENYKVEGFTWDQVIKDFGWNAYHEGMNEAGRHW